MAEHPKTMSTGGFYRLEWSPCSIFAHISPGHFGCVSLMIKMCPRSGIERFSFNDPLKNIATSERVHSRFTRFTSLSVCGVRRGSDHLNLLSPTGGCPHKTLRFAAAVTQGERRGRRRRKPKKHQISHGIFLSASRPFPSSRLAACPAGPGRGR